MLSGRYTHKLISPMNYTEVISSISISTHAIVMVGISPEFHVLTLSRSYCTSTKTHIFYIHRTLFLFSCISKHIFFPIFPIPDRIEWMPLSISESSDHSDRAHLHLRVKCKIHIIIFIRRVGTLRVCKVAPNRDRVLSDSR